MRGIAEEKEKAVQLVILKLERSRLGMARLIFITYQPILNKFLNKSQRIGLNKFNNS